VHVAWLVRRRVERQTAGTGKRSRTREKITVEANDRRVIHLGAGEGSKSLWVLGELVTYKTTSKQTGGAYSLFEVASRPGGGPPPHVQHREDESFYVLEGEYEFLNEDRTVMAGAGSLVYVPRGNLHAYRNVGTTPGRMLVSQTPGGLHERFFEEIGKAVTARTIPMAAKEAPPDVGSIVAIAAKYGIEVPPPPDRQADGKGPK
jgi:mannose-6-phosphate isomerase-like protein (cupin superfamily)